MLGKIEKIPVRSYWKNEEQDFTPWLAKDENIQVLSEEIGIDIEVEDTEVYIGSFKADIVARDAHNNIVIIENQLEKTDHKHLGQLITYASGVDAKFVIWICTSVTDEHRQAIDWINEVTNSEIGFFVCEIELWKIGESLPAPKFHIIASPNDWAKIVKSGSKIKNLTDTKQLHLSFWNGFKEYMESEGTELKLRTPRPQHWYTLAIGRSKFSISLTTNTQSSTIACEVYIRGDNAKVAFSKLMVQKEGIEKELGELEWLELPEGKDCRIKQVRTGNSKDQTEWHELHEWMKNRSENFYSVFSPRIKKLIL